MKKVTIAAALLWAGVASAGTAFYERDWEDGQFRYCVYTYLGQEYIITKRRTTLCPLTVEVDDGSGDDDRGWRYEGY